MGVVDEWVVANGRGDLIEEDWRLGRDELVGTAALQPAGSSGVGF